MFCPIDAVHRTDGFEQQINFMFVKPVPKAVHIEIALPAELPQTSFNTAREKH